jgi:DNA-binding response OmpR family regulator
MTAALRVLVIEDEFLIAMLLEEFLLDLNFEPVGPIARLDDAVAAVNSLQFDVALLDINLGTEVSYPVADMLTARGVPFAFMSGTGRDSFPDQYRSQTNLAKPYTLDDVSSVLAMLTNQRKS